MDYTKRMEKFYSGEMSQEEVLEFLEWLESPEAEEVLTAEIIHLWSEKIKDAQLQWDNRPLWEKINREKQGFSSPYLMANASKLPRRQKKVLWWSVAASILLIVSSWWLWHYRDVSHSVPGDFSSENEIEWIYRTNPPGQKTKIVLPDGSTVILNAASSIQYPQLFSLDRRVFLSGEAFFDVVSNPEFPFSVEAEGIVTTAVGTSFNVSTFENDHKVAVTLVTGRVNLTQREQGMAIDLSPGEESVLSAVDTDLVKYLVNTSDRILWTQGILKFDDVFFPEMVRILERWYGVTIHIAGSPRADQATGRFERDEPLTNVLHVLRDVYSFDYEIKGKDVYLKFN